MYWIAASGFLFLIGSVVLDWRRLRAVVPAGLTGLILAGIHVGAPTCCETVRLQDTGPLQGNVPLTLLLQIVTGPTFAMWFAQGLGTTPVGDALRLLQFTGLGHVYWWMAVEAGRATWRGQIFHFFLTLAWFGAVLAVQTYCQRRVRSKPEMQA